MILFIHDLSGIFFSSIHEYCSRENATDIDEDLLRGMILTRINYINKKLSRGRQFKTAIAMDSRKGYWRRDMFQYYKGKRKENRDASKVDWDSIFQKWERIIAEYKANIPYIFIDVDKAEGDDVHAALTFKLHDEFTEIINVTSDEDMAQLMDKFKNVKQFSLKRKKMITPEDVKYDLFTHIVKGDKDDGVPNIFSADNSIMEGVRQKAVRATSLTEWKSMGGFENPEVFCNEEQLRRFKMNKILVDFDEIPIDLIDKIYEEYRAYKTPKQKCFDYFFKHGLTMLMEEFKA